MIDTRAKSGEKGRIRDRLVCLVVLLVSANPAIFVFPKELVYVLPASVLLVLWFASRPKMARSDLHLLGGALVFSIVHLLSFGGDVLTASLGFLTRLLLALVAVRFAPRMWREFTAIMYVLCLLSFVFYVPVLLGVDLETSLLPLRAPIAGTDMVHIWVHNFHLRETASRNCGMFGEPGMFAGYIILAMLFLLSERPLNKRRAVVLVAALLSTQSTTGYIAFIPILLMWAVTRAAPGYGARRFMYALPLVVGLLALAWHAYDAVPFLGKKIEEQYEASMVSGDQARINRIGNAMFDLDYILQRPLFGWSPRHAVRAELDPTLIEAVSGQGNGLSGFAVKFGVLGLAFMLYYVFLAWRVRYGNVILAGMAVAVIALILAGEQFFDGPFFLALAFLPGPSSEGVSSRAGQALEPVA